MTLLLFLVVNFKKFHSPAFFPTAELPFTLSRFNVVISSLRFSVSLQSSAWEKENLSVTSLNSRFKNAQKDKSITERFPLFLRIVWRTLTVVKKKEKFTDKWKFSHPHGEGKLAEGFHSAKCFKTSHLFRRFGECGDKKSKKVKETRLDWLFIFGWTSLCICLFVTWNRDSEPSIFMTSGWKPEGIKRGSLGCSVLSRVSLFVLCSWCTN